MKPYDLLLAKSEEIGWHVHYKKDLTEIDKEALEELKPEKFIWVVRECGTHLLPLIESSTREKKLAITWMRAAVSLHPEARGFLVANGRMKEINILKAFPPEKINMKI